MRIREPGVILKQEIASLYAAMAKVAAKKAVEYAGNGHHYIADAEKQAVAATRWAQLAGGNAWRSRCLAP